DDNSGWDLKWHLLGLGRDLDSTRTGELLALAFFFFLAHSFITPGHEAPILDPKDTCWIDYFTDAELEEIKKENMVKLDPLPTAINDYLKSYIGKHTSEELFEHHNAKLFHPIKEADLHWAQKIITEALNLYFYDFFPIVDRSEVDIIHRVWHCIEKCYDESNIKVRRLISRLLLSLIVMDTPKGSITRVSKIGPLTYPDAPDVFSKKIIPILSLIWGLG
ncbi:hypothetical protein INT45_000319, partial [Circinella minor]